MGNTKNPSKSQWLIGTILFVVSIAATVLLTQNPEEKGQIHQKSQVATPVATTEDAALSEQEILTKTDQLLSILYTLYFISLDESGDPETEYELILDMMGETLNDKRKLESLRIQVAQFSSSKDELVASIGQALDFSLASLAENHATFSEYLRTIDTQNIDTTEFGYQITSFSSENKGAFDTLNRAALLFPYLWLDLTEEEGEISEWAISGESRVALIADIEDRFGDILEEDAINHEMTGNTNSVAFIVQSDIDFLEEPSG